ncbi:MAG: DUF1015 family protein [bacterium]|nr:DUF1015 family protein [bacterium]
MANIKPFACVRPNKEVASQVAALPYDVYNREEAKEAVKGNPRSFLNIDRAETQFDDSIDIYAPQVYQKAKELLDRWMADKTLITDEEKCYYIYQLIMDGRTQTGIVACSSIDDYQNNIIKKHEKTREEKEIDRINHVDICNAQTGPIFLAYRANETINRIVSKQIEKTPLYHFISEDRITHNVWKIEEKEDIDAICTAFSKINQIYIADGHHRAASAVKVGLKRRQENPEYTGNEEFNYFLSVLFPDEQLKILPYNRAVKDLNGYSKMEFLELVSKSFKVTLMGTEGYQPTTKGTFGMYLDEQWYELTAKNRITAQKDPVKSLDVAILQDYLLHPILGIDDPRTDKRIDFIGGIRGLSELERRVRKDSRVAFSMYPTSIEELFAVADAGLLMPPKSTWFEPKLRSGLFIHKL